MNIRIWFLFFLWSAAFLAELRCAAWPPIRTTTLGFDTPTLAPGSGSSSSVDAGGKRDMNQTLSSRQKRRNLAVDFAVPSLLRNYLTEFTKRPLNGDCLTFNGCYTVRANLQMHCIPLQKTISTFVDSNWAAAAAAAVGETAAGNASTAGRLLPDLDAPPPLSRVLSLGLTKASRKSNQVVVEIGEDVVRTGCGGLFVDEEAPVFTLEMDLTTILEWWLGAEGGRLRVRLMPEKKAQVPGMEDKYTAAIRAADPRLFFQIASRGEPLAGRSEAGVPRGYWNFSWVAEDKLSFPRSLGPTPDPRCSGGGKSCDRRPPLNPDVTWSVVAAEDPRPGGDGWRGTGDKERSPQGWEEGQFLWVNGSVFCGPWVLSPWLWGGPVPCGLDMAVFLHPRQSGRYTVWIIERDKPPLVLLSTDTLPPITG